MNAAEQHKKNNSRLITENESETNSSSSVELLAPAGNFESLQAALNAGADAVYFGVGELNMRSGAGVNFSIEDLPEITGRCHAHGAKAYLTLNTVIYDTELEEMRALCGKALEAGVDACIAGDMAVILHLRAIGLPVHMTVQCNICNLDAVRFYARFADVMVLARELPLGAIKRIVDGIRAEGINGPSGNPVRVEVFAHGALCVAISGKCYMSLSTYHSSANRGKCLQNCRRKYLVRDYETGAELAVENEYVMSPKDLCTVNYLDKILNAGVSVLKLEGRGRSADYVATVVSVYREALDAWRAQTFSQEAASGWKKRLQEVFNRGFWDGGYYLGKTGDEWCASNGNQATLLKTHLGRICNYFSRLQVAELKIESGSLQCGDRILICGASTGALELRVGELRIDNQRVEKASKGDSVSFPLSTKVRNTDKVYLLSERTDFE